MYREVGLMQVVEILRRWQAGDSARVIARGMGLARDTVRKYLREAKRLVQPGARAPVGGWFRHGVAFPDRST